jgi:hypothetical protein
MTLERLSLVALTLPALWSQPKVALAPIDPSLSGITVIAANDSRFESAVATLIKPRDMPAFKPLLPYSVVVRNDTSRNLLGLCVVFRMIDQNGHAGGTSRNFKNFPTGRKPLLIPGQMMLVSVEQPRLQPRASGVRLKIGMTHPLDYYDSSQAVNISLDSVLFEDGTFVGPDTVDTFDRTAAELSAVQTLAKSVLAYKSEGGAAALQKYLADTAASFGTSLQKDETLFESTLGLKLAQRAGMLSDELSARGAEAVFSDASAMLNETANVTIHKGAAGPPK